MLSGKYADILFDILCGKLFDILSDILAAGIYSDILSGNLFGTLAASFHLF